MKTARWASKSKIEDLKKSLTLSLIKSGLAVAVKIEKGTLWVTKNTPEGLFLKI